MAHSPKKLTAASTLALAGMLTLAAGSAQASYDCEYYPEYCIDETVQQRSSTTQTITLISRNATSAVKALRSKLRGGNNTAATGRLSGLSAGGQGNDMGAWIDGELMKSDDDQSNVESDLSSVAIGGDMRMGNSVVGVALAYQNIDNDSLNGTDSEVDSFSISPYYARSLTDNLLFDISVGYAWLEEDQSNNTSFDTERYFMGANLTGFVPNTGDWEFVARLSYIFSHDNADAYAAVAANDTSFAQASASLEGSYLFENWSPYAYVTFEQDLVYEVSSASTYDADGAKAGIGARLNISDRVVGEVGMTTSFGRDRYNAESILANLRVDF
uniref:Autotransporter domain-containing protein n=1 Tax=Magnetococcus massalia (strain MO-1) TaxID=451514 RepID=A0A1S7LHH3_MAGMO|nr:Conserved protein of unknown function. Containing autotransporter beta-domain [Candidatus Magnetococcus massalia]